MRNPFSKIGLIAVAVSLAASLPLAAQDTTTPRCGGLLCDLGMFGSGSERTTLPCDDFVCRAFGGSRPAEASPPPPAATPEPAPVKETAVRPHRRHGTVARKEVVKSAPDAAEKK